MKTKYVIIDWANNLMFDGKEFDSFEEGWEFIYENIIEEYEGDGTYDDVFVVKKSEYKPNYGLFGYERI